MTVQFDPKAMVANSKLASTLPRRNYETQEESDLLKKRVAQLESAPQAQVDAARVKSRSMIMTRMAQTPTRDLPMTDRVQYAAVLRNDEAVKARGAANNQAEYTNSDLTLSQLARRNGMVDMGIELEASSMVGNDRHVQARIAEDARRKANHSTR